MRSKIQLRLSLSPPASRFPGRRHGFTLIELMVAMALTLFVMAILTEAFVAAIDTFTGLKGIGDMQGNLRVAGNSFRYDLAQDHLMGKVRLSDPYRRPTEGFFLVQQGSVPNFPNYPYPTGPGVPNPPYCIEGNDGDGIESLRAIDHLLYFTVKLKGNRRESFHKAILSDPAGAPVLDPTRDPALRGAPFDFVNYFKTHYFLGPNELQDATFRDPPSSFTQATYHGQWAEVAYYLERGGSTEEPENPASVIGLPVFNLMRSQFVAINDDSGLEPSPSVGYFPYNNKYPPTAASQIKYREPPIPSYFLLPGSILGDISCNGRIPDPSDYDKNYIDFYTPTDLANAFALDASGSLVSPVVPTRSLQANPSTGLVSLNALSPTQAVGRTYGESVNKSLLLTNVLSFQVRVMLQGTDVSGPSPVQRRTEVFVDLNQFGYDSKGNLILLPFGQFDTGTPMRTASGLTRSGTTYVNYRDLTGQQVFTPSFPIGAVTPQIRQLDDCSILAVQITLRIWDNKTRQVRQTSIIQEL